MLTSEWLQMTRLKQWCAYRHRKTLCFPRTCWTMDKPMEYKKQASFSYLSSTSFISNYFLYTFSRLIFGLHVVLSCCLNMLDGQSFWMVVVSWTFANAPILLSGTLIIWSWSSLSKWKLALTGEHGTLLKEWVLLPLCWQKLFQCKRAMKRSNHRRSRKLLLMWSFIWKTCYPDSSR